jgi:5S rRNA maturation endonuclease (ribonuclease M5)
MQTLEKDFSEQINKIKQSETLVVVEGKKDKIALESLGITNIIELNKKPLFEIIENISSKNKNCIILTDLDKQGKQLYGKLNSGLQQFGVKIDNNFRNFLFKKTHLRQIEGINTYIENIENNHKTTKLINH